MEYIGSLCQSPDSRKNVMLVFYTMERRIDKSNFFKLHTSLPETVNSCMQHLTNGILESVDCHIYLIKLCWFEGIASVITASVQSGRNHYYEEEVHGDITIFSGASDNWTGIVVDKMTTYDVDRAEQHNKVNYGKLIGDVIKNENEMNKFYIYYF
ncbi:hypothetical protein Plhal304r1_c079g0165561 [Plasmopara halstedii]